MLLLNLLAQACLVNYLGRCPFRTSASMCSKSDPSVSSTDQVLSGFPTPVEHSTIILVSQAQDCGGDFDPALFLSSPTQTARVATLRTLSLQHVSPGLLCFQSLATQASYTACGALESTPISLASSHVTSPCCFCSRKESIRFLQVPKFSCLSTFCFPCMEHSFL